MVGGRFRVVRGGFRVVRGRFGVIDRLLRFVGRSRMVRFLLRIVRSSLIGDLGDISVVMVSSVRHMLSSTIGKSNGVRACRVCTHIVLRSRGDKYCKYASQVSELPDMSTSLSQHFHQKSRLP